jgi:hypothetical protein
MKLWFCLLSIIPFASALADVTFNGESYRIQNESLASGAKDPIPLSEVFSYMEKNGKMDKGRLFRSPPSLERFIQNTTSEIDELKALANRPRLPAGTLAVIEKNIQDKKSELEYAETTLENLTVLIDFLKSPRTITVGSQKGLDGKGESLSSLMSAMTSTFEEMWTKHQQVTSVKQGSSIVRELELFSDWMDTKKEEHEAYSRFGGCTAACNYVAMVLDSRLYVVGYNSGTVKIVRSGDRETATGKLEKGCRDFCRFNHAVQCETVTRSIRCGWPK